jgi:hypothetical protein
MRLYNIQEASQFTKLMKSIWVDWIIHKSPTTWKTNTVIYNLDKIKVIN